MKLWHDDIRKPPDSSWKWARTNLAAMEVLETQDVTECSLDHDMGLDRLDPTKINHPHLLRGHSPSGDGQDLVRWMVESKKVPKKVRIHSYNPSGAMRMQAELIRYAQEEGQELEVEVRPFNIDEYEGVR